MATDSVEFWCGLFVGVSYVLSSLPGCDVGYDVSSMNSVSYVVNFFQIDTVARCSVLFDHFFYRTAVWSVTDAVLFGFISSQSLKCRSHAR